LYSNEKGMEVKASTLRTGCKKVGTCGLRNDRKGKQDSMHSAFCMKNAEMKKHRKGKINLAFGCGDAGMKRLIHWEREQQDSAFHIWNMAMWTC
jgi:hypothetical protein